MFWNRVYLRYTASKYRVLSSGSCHLLLNNFWNRILIRIMVCFLDLRIKWVISEIGYIFRMLIFIIGCFLQLGISSGHCFEEFFAFGIGYIFRSICVLLSVFFLIGYMFGILLRIITCFLELDITLEPYFDFYVLFRMRYIFVILLCLLG